MNDPNKINKEEIYKEYIHTKVDPIIQNLVVDLLLNRPDDVIDFMVTWLNDKRSVYSDIKNKVPDSQTKLKDQPNAYGEFSEPEDEDEEGDDVDDLINTKLAQKVKNGRQSVSAEVYGTFNQKKQYVPKVIEKSEDTKQQISDKISNLFLFNALDIHDMKIVIDAFEEKVYEDGEYVIK